MTIQWNERTFLITLDPLQVTSTQLCGAISSTNARFVPHTDRKWGPEPQCAEWNVSKPSIHDESPKPAIPHSPNMDKASPSDVVHQIQLSIEGMTCASCVAKVEKALRALPNVREATVSLLQSKADICSVDANTNLLIKTVNALGYKTGLLSEVEKDLEADAAMGQSEILFGVEGMTCASCVSKVEHAVESTLPGIIQVNVNLATLQASVKYDSTKTGARHIKSCIEDLGYTVTILGSQGTARYDQLQAIRLKEQRQLKTALAISAVFALPVFLISMVLPHISSSIKHGLNTKIWSLNFKGVLDMAINNARPIWSRQSILHQGVSKSSTWICKHGCSRGYGHIRRLLLFTVFSLLFSPCP